MQYDGSRYKGWQRLGDNQNTIQEKLENILKEQFKKDIEVIGASRTDAGVHAKAQTANFKLEEEVSSEQMKKILNKYLPEDISVIKVSIVNDRFHSRYNAKSKTYVYKIWNGDYQDPFIRKYSMHIPEKLNLKKMIFASKSFVGKNDFTAFSTPSSKNKSMIREINVIDIEEKEGLVTIIVKGRSFLYKMVRRIVASLIEVGLGNIEPEKIKEILLSKERKQSGLIADAKGLFLEKIEF
jgi:tRNA pseudouridine38-40 synthase